MTKENINFDDQKEYDFASSVNFTREVYLDSLLSPTFFCESINRHLWKNSLLG